MGCSLVLLLLRSLGRSCVSSLPSDLLLPGTRCELTRVVDETEKGKQSGLEAALSQTPIEEPGGEEEENKGGLCFLFFLFYFPSVASSCSTIYRAQGGPYNTVPSHPRGNWSEAQPAHTNQLPSAMSDILKSTDAVDERHKV